MKRNHKPLFNELFRIYKIQRFLFLELGLIFIGTGITPIFEKASSEANITDLGKSMWWALVTVSGTGYGDYYPITIGGRVIGTILMFSGIALFSTTVALVASFYSHRRTKRETQKLQVELDEMQQKLGTIESKLDYLIKKDNDRTKTRKTHSY